MSIAQQVLRPLLGAADVNLITGTDSGTHITQSETFATANPDNPQEVVVAYNDSRDWGSFIDISGASWSTDGGNTFTRLTNAFSKKWENHEAMFALFAAWYNFCRRHQTLETTPAVAAGLAGEPWTMERLLQESANALAA